MPSKLETARQIINEVDARMAALFVQRMRAAELVYEHKKEFGLPILDEKREAAVIERNAALIEDEVLKPYYIDYLKQMMAVSRAYQYRLQNKLNVACSGAEGTFSHLAAGRIFPESNRIPFTDCKAAYGSVASGECDVAVLPVENSDPEEAGPALDLIFAGNLFINGIYELKGHQNAPDITVVDPPETGNRAARTRRFAVLSRAQANSPALPHSLLMFTVKDGEALASAIRILQSHGNDTDALRNRSLNHYFYIEISGTVTDLTEQLGQVCDQVKIAGTFAPHVEI